MKAAHARPIKEYCVGIFDGPHATPSESDDGAIYLGIKNLSEDGRLDLSEIRHVSENDLPKWIRRVEPQPGDLVFTYEATLHRYAIIPEGFRGCLGRRVALVRPDTNKVAPLFLLYYFLSARWRQVVESNIITGATVDRIPIERFPDFPVSLPDLPVQKRIADIISAYDEQIDNNIRRIKLLEESARLLYEEWFARLRFPGHEHTRIVKGVPEGWETFNVPDLIEINPRTVPPEGEILYVPMASLSERSMTVSFKEMEKRAKPTGAKFRNGDILFPRITPCLENGKTAFVNFLAEGEIACGSTEFIVLRGKKVTPEFVYSLARTYEFRENAIKSMIGSSGRQRVQETCFGEFRVILPPRLLLDQFEEITSSIFKMIAKLHFELEKLKQARNILLPKLMSQEIEL